MKYRYQLIIFDWDGTLIDSIDWIVSCLQNAAQECHLDVPDEGAARDIIGLSLKNAMVRLFPDIDEDIQGRLLQSYSRLFFSRQMTKRNLFSGVYDMLIELKSLGFQLGVATGKTRAGLQKALQLTETTDLFNATRCADETASKPDPRMLHEIIEQLDVDARNVLMVGDSTHDLQMAMNAGIDALAVSCGAHSSAILEKFNPLACLRQTADLLAIMRGD
ncbi:MAG: HAD-IA family hydrolase [Gammaproteobacteria bacterium]